jgi:hypothetical protein
MERCRQAAGNCRLAATLPTTAATPTFLSIDTYLLVDSLMLLADLFDGAKWRIFCSDSTGVQ